MKPVLVFAVILLLTDLSLCETFPVGDVRACLQNVSGVDRFEVLPGSGWDNLRNVESGMVLALNYSECRTTDDNRFLIPDFVNVYPVKTSRIDAFAEIIEHWTDYESGTSKSINADVGFKGAFSISGSFSDEFMYSKKKQLKDNSLVTRIQARYVRYKAVLQPGMPLNQGFKNRLLTIAGSLELDDMRQARFLSQQLVREFGTHVSISVDAGAAILQEEQVSLQILNSSHYTKSALQAAAGFSFGINVGTLFGGVSYSDKYQKTLDEFYMNNRTDSLVRSIGGSMLNRTNMTTDEWVKGIEKDLVAIDRSGEPIYNFITAQTLPEIPASTLLQLTGMVQEAVMTYYKVNTYPGCTDRRAPNFSPRANVEDGSCKPPSTNLSFGGVFQKCNSSSTQAGDLCKSLSQTNPATGDFSCPQGYEAVSLYAAEKTKEEVVHVCGSCWLIFGHCCHDEVKNSTASYETFWCVALNEEQQDSGYMFGGVFTAHLANPVTSAMTCPHFYIPLKMGENIRVCVSDDYLMAVEYSIPFAGFFSCTAGNPLALGTTNNSVWAHMYTQGPQQWPRRCPLGYSSYTTEVMPEDGCEVNHCMMAGALADIKLPTVKRPPFIHPPVATPSSENKFIFDPAQNLWLKNADADKYNNTPRLTQSLYDGQSGKVYYKTGTTDKEVILSQAVLFAISAILAIVIFVMIIAIWKIKKEAIRQRQFYNRNVFGNDNHALNDVVAEMGGNKSN